MRIVSFLEGLSSDKGVLFEATVWVFANISGMLSFLPSGSIHSINDNFSLMLFGFTQHDLVGQVGNYCVSESGEGDGRG